MAELFAMPQASPTMEKGTILAWHKKEGDALAPQDVLAEVETDKAAMAIEIFDAGHLLRILVPAGQEVPAGTPIAIIGKRADEDISALLAGLSGASPAAPAPRATPSAPSPDASAGPSPAPAPSPEAAPSPAPAPSPAAGLPPLTWMGKAIDPAILEIPAVYAPTLGPAEGDGGRVRSSPAARRAAAERGVDIGRVAGTGPRGRVTVADVERVPAPTAAPAPALADLPAAAPVRVRNSQMRKTIARRLRQVWQDAPSFFLTARFSADRLAAFRAELKEAGLAVSPNDLLIRAVALALRDVPEVNASWGEEEITRHERVHIGMAVALDDGLITPVLRDADRKGLARIAQESRELAGRARERRLQPEEYQGSTFTISNLGMMGIEQFTAILNPPEAAILAVGAMQLEPVAGPEGPRLGQVMRVTMTCDHRVIDGALGARFLQALRRYVEAPALLAG